MNLTELRQLLDAVGDGTVDASAASDRILHALRAAPFDDLGFARVDCSRAVDAGLVTRPLAETVDAVLDEFATLVDDDPRRRGKLTPERERELIARWRERTQGRNAAGATP